MQICKQGYDHFLYDINNQDTCFQNGLFKGVFDGCSESPHAEVGTKLFSMLLQKRLDIIINDENEILCGVFYELLVKIDAFNTLEWKVDKQIIYDYLLFTIIFMYEDADHFWVYYCGDGFVIKQRYNDEINYIELTDRYKENTPKYYAYKFSFDDEKEIEFKCMGFEKSAYKRIGIASDGLEYLFNLPEKEQKEFEKYLINDEEMKIRRLINRNREKFKDDISIVW